MTTHDCCYCHCPEPGAIHIGKNGNPDTHWICFRHYYKWNADRARFLADGGGCEMQELGELLERSTGRCCNGLCEANVL
jgi:hypothetical protein